MGIPRKLRLPVYIAKGTLLFLLAMVLMKASPALATDTKDASNTKDVSNDDTKGVQMLGVGDVAPDFELNASDGSTVKLSKLKGKTVVLYFYPKDNTPGCTKEACNIRDNWSEYKKRGWLVYGVSSDSIKSHEKFINDFSLPFPLLSDPDQTVQKLYGSYGKKKFAGREYEGTFRYTFVIGPDQKLLYVDRDVKVTEHSEDLFHAVDATK